MSDYVIGGPHHHKDDDSGEEHWTAEIQIVGGHYSVAEIYAADPDHAMEMARKATAAWDAKSNSAEDACFELVGALNAVMGWVKAWDSDFVMDDEWPETEAKVRSALMRAGEIMTPTPTPEPHHD